MHYKKNVREALRRQKELKEKQAQSSRMTSNEHAAYMVDIYKNHIDVLTTLHMDCSEPITWKRILAEGEPKRPQRDGLLEQEATHVSATYRPNFWERALKVAAQKREILLEKIKAAREDDEIRYHLETEQWVRVRAEWEEMRDLGFRILEGDRQAKLDAIEVTKPFSEIAQLGSSVKIIPHDDNVIEVRLSVNGTRVIPKESIDLLEDGKLLTQIMAVEDYNLIHYRYICSSILRIGREIFAILPGNLVIATAFDEVPSSLLEGKKTLPVLSVVFTRAGLGNFSSEDVDPSDVIGRFFHRLVFDAATGFDAVTALVPEDFL